MPRRGVNIRVDDEDVTDGEVLSPAQADAARAEQNDQDDILKKLTELAGSTAGDARWTLTRTTGSDQGHVPVTLSTDELTLDMIARVAGPGTYRVRGTSADGRFIGQKTVRIARLAGADQPGTMLTPGRALGASGTDAERLLAIIQQQNLGRREDVKFWGSLIITAATALGPALIALFKRPDTQLSDLVSALAGVKQLTATPDPMEAMGKMAEAMGKFSSLMPEREASRGATMWDAILGVMKEAGPAMAMLARRGGAPAAAPSQQLPPAAGETPMPQRPIDLTQVLAAQLPQLVALAVRRSDPQLYGALIADQIPEGADLASLHELLAAPDWFERLTAQHAAVAQHREWFEALREDLMARLFEPESEAPGGAREGEDEGAAAEGSLSTAARAAGGPRS